MTTQTIGKQKTMNKTRINLFLDIGLLLAFLLLTEVRATGLTLHEWGGLLLVAVLVVHILLHWDWVQAVTRRFFQKNTLEVRLRYIINVVIFVGFTAIILSGLMISHRVLPFFGLQHSESRFWHWLHHEATNLVIWSVALHIGLHWNWVVKNVKRYLPWPTRTEQQPVNLPATEPRYSEQ